MFGHSIRWFSSRPYSSDDYLTWATSDQYSFPQVASSLSRPSSLLNAKNTGISFCVKASSLVCVSSVVYTRYRRENLSDDSIVIRLSAEASGVIQLPSLVIVVASLVKERDCFPCRKPAGPMRELEK